MDRRGFDAHAADRGCQLVVEIAGWHAPGGPRGRGAVKALKRGLQALDHPKLIGVVFNEATEIDQDRYEGQYHGGSKNDDGPIVLYCHSCMPSLER